MLGGWRLRRHGRGRPRAHDVVELPPDDVLDLPVRHPRPLPGHLLLQLGLLGPPELVRLRLQRPDLRLHAGLLPLQVVVAAHDALGLLDELGGVPRLDAKLAQAAPQQAERVRDQVLDLRLELALSLLQLGSPALLAGDVRLHPGLERRVLEVEQQ